MLSFMRLILSIKDTFVRSAAICCLVVAVLAGCSSSLVVGKVYDTLGSRAAKRFKSHADFTDPQKQQIDSLAASYHSWHRTTQLPVYAQFLRDMAVQVESADNVSLRQADNWWQAARGFSDQMHQCNPFNVSANLFVGLNDKQVNQIASRRRAEINEREDEYRAETEAARLERRVKEMTKWGKRAGFGFNDAQAELLRTTLQSQISLGAQRYELRRQWAEGLIVLLSQRAQADFNIRVTRHIDTNWRITENAFPQQWRHNEGLWTQFIRDFINLQTDEQRRVFLKKLANTAQTLEKLSVKNPKQAPVCHRG